MSSRKKHRPSTDLFSDLHDDVVLIILSKLSASASSPSDFLTVLLTCKRMNKLAMSPSVLKELNVEAMTMKASKWTEASHKFLKRCVHSGNVEAHYLLGMIRFYCLGIRASGTSLMAKAAMMNHAPSLYSLALIHFNGKKDLEAGVALCARAAYLGSIDAVRELGHCLLDGYGVRRDIRRGRRFILQASLLKFQSQRGLKLRRIDTTHRFLREWFECKRLSTSTTVCGGDGGGGGDVGCSNGMCGRVETRPSEFRRCAVCSVVKYCSRACQVMHWRSRHKNECGRNGVGFGDAERAE